MKLDGFIFRFDDEKYDSGYPAQHVAQDAGNIFLETGRSVGHRINPPEKSIINQNITVISQCQFISLGASEISKNALQITLYLATKFKAEVYIACISPTTEELVISEKLVNEAVKLLESEQISVIGSCGIGRPSEHILELSEEFNPNLIVMPIPYGERAETFDIESLGATVDLVMRKCRFPILLVRKPKFKSSELTKNMFLIIDKMENIKAAEFALTLGEKGSKLKLFSVTEKETVEKVEVLAEFLTVSEIGKGIIERVHKREIQSLINGIVDESKIRGIIIERMHLVGNRLKLILEEIKHEHTIIVLSARLEEGNFLGSEVENLVKFSKIPILLVKI